MLTQPQIWTLIGVFAAMMFSVLGVVSGMFVRVLRAEIGGLRGEMNAKFERVDAQFARIDDRLNYLDRDVQSLSNRVFGDQD